MARVIIKRRFFVPVVLALLVLSFGGLCLHSLFAERYAQSASDAIATGKTQLFQKSVSGALNAYQTFRGAYANDYGSATDEQKIKIRVYLAVTRMLDTLLRDDGGSVDTLAELLAQFGITRTGDAFDALKFTPPPMNNDGKPILPAAAPSSAEALRVFFAGPFLTAVNASIADMDAAIALCPTSGEGIDREIISKTLINAGDATQPDVEMDAGDYYLFRSLLKFLKVYALMSAGYNAEINIREIVALVNMEADQKMLKILSDRYPDFLKIRDAVKLNEARTTLIDAIDDYMTASEKIRNDNVVQAGAEELISVDTDDYTEGLLRENLAKIKASLQGNTAADLVTERIGTEYWVYGGMSFTTTEPSWWEKGNHPEQYGYTYLGKASDTAVFYGPYNCYIITTRPGNMAPVDTVQGSNGVYLGTNTTGATSQWWNIGGAQNGAYALIGGDSGGNSNGFVVIRPQSAITSLTVYLTNVAGIAREEHFNLNLFPLFGDGATAPKALRDLLPQLNEFGYGVPRTMGYGLGNDPTLGGILPDFSTQDQWISQMDGIFLPSGLLTIPQVADGAIAIDGSAADWTAAGISPVLTDITGERGEGTSPGGDLVKAFLARDSIYLYVRMDLAGNWNGQAGQNFMYGLRFRKTPGNGPDKPGDVKVFARNRNGVWEVRLQTIQANGWYGLLTDQGASAAAAGNLVEWRVPLASLGTIDGRFLAADTDSWSYYQQWDYGWYPYDQNPTCLQIQTPASVTGTLSVPAYDGVGPVRIGVFEYGPDFSTDPKKRVGSQIVFPDDSGHLPASYTISGLPVEQRVFVSVFWDRDGNGVVSPGDYTNFYLPFTTAAGANSLHLTAGDDHPDYPPPQFNAAFVYHEKLPAVAWDVLIAASLTGPSPEDVTVTVTGPGGEFRLTPGAWIGNRLGLIYKTNVSWLPDGDYTFTAVDSLGRKAERTVHYEARYDLPEITGMTPTSGAYTGTATPTLSWTPPAAGGPYAYQVWVVDYNSASNGVSWYVSDLTAATSVTVPAGVLLPDAPYAWFVRLFDSSAHPMNFTRSASSVFYTGAYAATPAYSFVRIGSRPPTGTNPNYSHWVDAKVPGVAPWHTSAWRLKKGGSLIAQGPSTAFFNRTDDAFFEVNFSTPTPLLSGDDYAFEMDIRSGTMTLSQTAIPFVYASVPAVEVTSLTPSNNYYFKTSTPTFSWGPVSDPNAYYRLRIYESLGRLPLYTSAWSQATSAIVPAGVLKAGGTYYWTVMTAPSVNPISVSVYANTEGNSGNKALFRLTLQPPVKGDVSGNGEIGLEDAILALQVASGLKPTVMLPGDVNAYNRIGLPEAIYILQEVSGLR